MLSGKESGELGGYIAMLCVGGPPSKKEKGFLHVSCFSRGKKRKSFEKKECLGGENNVVRE